MGGNVVLWNVLVWSQDWTAYLCGHSVACEMCIFHDTVFCNNWLWCFVTFFFQYFHVVCNIHLFYIQCKSLKRNVRGRIKKKLLFFHWYHCNIYLTMSWKRTDNNCLFIRCFLMKYLIGLCNKCLILLSTWSSSLYKPPFPSNNAFSFVEKWHILPR